MLPVFASSKFFSFQAELNSKYLQSVYRKKAAGGRIKASADTVVANARTRFLVERSEEEEGLIHVRCCYNNKYWAPVRVQDSGSCRWIIGTTNEPEEDLSSPSCTLFQALPVKDNSIRLLHSGLQKFACVGNETYLQLDGGDDQENKSDNFTVGFPQHEKLPKHVAFKGDNGKYLCSRSEPLFTLPFRKVKWEYFIRLFASHISDERAIFTTFTNADGTVRIKSNTGGFWRRAPDNTIIAPLVQQGDNDPDSFEVVTSDGFITLRNVGNNRFCKTGWDFNPKEDNVNVCDDSKSQLLKLTLEVPVVRSEISDVKFYLDEARIYNKKILNVVPDIRTNDTSRELKATFSFTKKVERVSTWETNVSSKIGRTAKITYGSSGTPIVVGGEVTFSTESTTSEGRTTSETNTEETTLTQEYYIPERTTVAATFVATRASCDVPYSYKQTDVLTTEEEVSTDYHDGIYTVTNNYNFRIKVTDNEDEIRKLEGQYF